MQSKFNIKKVLIIFFLNIKINECSKSLQAYAYMYFKQVTDLDLRAYFLFSNRFIPHFSISRNNIPVSLTVKSLASLVSTNHNPEYKSILPL